MVYNSISIKPYIKSHLELQREITLIELAPSPYFFVLSICLAYMNMFARFDENPAMTLQDIKKTKLYERTHTLTHAHMHGQRENSIPTTNKVCGGINRGFRLEIRKFICHYALLSVVDPEGVQGFARTPLLRQNYLIFMENFQKNQEKFIINHEKFTNRTPLCKFKPLSRNPGPSHAYVGLDRRKPCLGGLQTTKAQTSLRICSV